MSYVGHLMDNKMMKELKQIAITIIMFCMIPHIIMGQAATWDSTYRPNIYKTLLGQFSSFPNSAQDIIFLGNSISSYTSWQELLGEENARNRGIPGDITFGVIDRLSEVIEGRPARVFVLIGINDIARNIPDSVITRNYKRIIDMIQAGSPSTKIYFHTLLPVNNTFTPSLPHFNKDEHILNINKELKRLAKKEQIALIDLYSAFIDSDNRLDRNFSFDGLHLNDKGYLKWATIIKNGNYLKEK